MAQPHLRLTSPDGALTAEFVPHAGMVCCSLMHDGEELLDPGHGLDAYAQHGKTMGIPLLYPWANRLDRPEYAVAGKTVTLPENGVHIPLDPNGLPIHGLVPGLMRWVPEPREREDTVAARLAWTTPELLAPFPFAHELRLQATADAGALTIATTVRATGEDTVPVSFGFHPYLRLPGTHRQTWRMRLPPSERLVLDQHQIPTGEREPVTQTDLDLADTSWDDGFELHAQPARYAVSTPGRGIAVDLLEGFGYSQIYAPPAHDFICFEPMTAPTNALRGGDGLSLVAPGAEYRAVFRVTAWRD